MAKTLLNGVNEVLKKASVLDEGAVLTSLSDSARQAFIDNAVVSLNDAVDRLYTLSRTPKPNQMAERTITLVTNDRDYKLHNDLIRIYPDFGFIDETNNHVISILEDPDGYRRIIGGDIEQDDTGLPSFGAIRPTDGEFVLDRAPTATYNGRVYKYRFEREFGLDAAGDEFPFTDAVFRPIVGAAHELWKDLQHNEYDDRKYRRFLAQAARRFRKIPPRRSWQPGGFVGHPTDPLEPA